MIPRAAISSTCAAALRVAVAGTAIACLAIAFAAIAAPHATRAAAQSDASTPTRAQIDEAIAAKKWSDAKSLIQKRKSSAEKSEAVALAALLKRVEGEIDLDEFEGDLAKVKKGWRKESKKLDQLAKKHDGIPEIETRVTGLRDQIRAASCFLLESFEEAQAGGIDLLVMGTVRISNPEFVKHGKSSMRFVNGGEMQFSFYFTPTQDRITDWTPYDAVVLWVYAEEKSGEFVIEAMGAADESSFRATVVVDWLGWREVVLPLKVQKGGFTATGKPSWKQISGIGIAVEKEDIVRVILDDLHLEKL